jgi:hypothetical protein
MVLAREVERSQDVAACFVTLKGDGSNVTLRKLELMTPFRSKCGAYLGLDMA